MTANETQIDLIKHLGLTPDRIAEARNRLQYLATAAKKSPELFEPWQLSKLLDDKLEKGFEITLPQDMFAVAMHHIIDVCQYKVKTKEQSEPYPRFFYEGFWVEDVLIRPISGVYEISYLTSPNGFECDAMLAYGCYNSDKDQADCCTIFVEPIWFRPIVTIEDLNKISPDSPYVSSSMNQISRQVRTNQGLEITLKSFKTFMPTIERSEKTKSIWEIYEEIEHQATSGNGRLKIMARLIERFHKEFAKVFPEAA